MNYFAAHLENALWMDMPKLGMRVGTLIVTLAMLVMITLFVILGKATFSEVLPLFTIIGGYWLGVQRSNGRSDK